MKRVNVRSNEVEGRSLGRIAGRADSGGRDSNCPFPVEPDPRTTSNCMA